MLKCRHLGAPSPWRHADRYNELWLPTASIKPLWHLPVTMPRRMLPRLCEYCFQQSEFSSFCFFAQKTFIHSINLFWSLGDMTKTKTTKIPTFTELHPNWENYNNQVSVYIHNMISESFKFYRENKTGWCDGICLVRAAWRRSTSPREGNLLKDTFVPKTERWESNTGNS